MLPVLPRELLWTDLKTMDEFFNLDPINEDYYEAFIKLNEEPFNIQADAIKVFNEVYYQVTRIVFERPVPAELDKYIAEIKADLGWNYSAGLVMSMSFWLVVNIEKKTRPLNKFFISAIRKRHGSSSFWKPFKHCFEKNRKDGKKITYDFLPRPIPIAQLQRVYIDWRTITRDYDLSSIEYIINLWDDHGEKRDVAKLIEASLSYGAVTKRNRIESEQLKRFFLNYLNSETNQGQDGFSCGQPCISHGYYRGMCSELERTVEIMKQKIFEIESDNERLNSLLNETKSKKEQERSFTLSLIVDYCKKSVEWDDVKSIVAMLNRLLRHDCTKEDGELVDSIEEAFKERVSGIQNIFNAPVGQKIDNVDKIINCDQ